MLSSQSYFQRTSELSGLLNLPRGLIIFASLSLAVIFFGRLFYPPSIKNVAKGIENTENRSPPYFTAYGLNFLPHLVETELTLADINIKFPPRTNLSQNAYVTLQTARTFSVNHPGVLQTLTMAMSLLATRCSHPFVILVPANIVIEPSARSIIDRLGISLYRYKNVPIPEYGMKYHMSRGFHRWVESYQRVHMFRLPYRKVIFLDSDMVVLRNLDHLFLRDDLAIGSDCSPHWKSKYNQVSNFTEGYKIASILLVHPSEETFALMNASIQGGVNYDRFGNATGWKWPQADQILFITLLKFSQLDCEYQAFPDTCLWAINPMKNFPLGSSYIMHYTWLFLHKSNMVDPYVFNNYASSMKIDLSIKNDGTLAERQTCWCQFVLVVDHFSKALKQLIEVKGLTPRDSLLSAEASYPECVLLQL